MSNPTSNYGWQMPTATDLVTDLPADFEVFGQAVDTALMDLKGGTTGQVLKKNTNADMDFVWGAVAGDIEGVTAGVGITGGGTTGTVTITNDMATTITAAGDIVIGTGSGTYDNLPIGTTAQVLTADTTVSPYKVKWATPDSGSYTQLATGTLSGASVAMTSIPGTYRDLILVLRAYQPNADGDQIYFYYNNDTTSIYQNVGVSSAGETSVGGAPSATMRIGYDVDSAVYANNFSYLRSYEYASAVNYKTAHYHFMHTPSSGTATNQAYGWQLALARLSSAITRLDVAIRTAGGSASSFLGGTYTLYGVK